MQEYDQYSQMMQSSAQIGTFAKQYVKAKAGKNVTHAQMLDSLITDGFEMALPAELEKIINLQGKNIQLDGLTDERKASLLVAQKASVLQGIQTGIEKYQANNGGEMPSDGVIASAITAAGSMLDSLEINSNAHAHLATVPALSLVTIAMRIANSLPLVAQLPNPIGSNTLPLVNVRYVSKNDRGYMKAGEYVDGEKAPLQYMHARYEFTAKSDDKTTYKLTPKTIYKDGTKEPDDNGTTLPVVAGGVTVLVNGIPVANDRTATNKTTGTNAITELDNLDVKVADKAVKVASGSVDMKTSEISVTFAEALDEKAEVSVVVYVDYEREDENGNVVVREPRLDISTEKAVLHAHATRASYTATTEALSQMQAELGVDVRSAFVAVVTGKLMLEENMSLLEQAKRRAKGNGLVFTSDLARGQDMTTAFNNTRDQAVEILPTIDLAIQAMNGKSNHAANGYDIYVSGKTAILINSLPDDTRYVPTNNAIGATNQVVKIGTLRGNINVYCVPETRHFKLFESGTKQVGEKHLNFGEMLIVARNAEPAKSMFVGFTAMPVITKEYLSEAFKSGVTFTQRHCAEMNPIRQYGNQSAVIQLLNIPTSLTATEQA